MNDLDSRIKSLFQFILKCKYIEWTYHCHNNIGMDPTSSSLYVNSKQEELYVTAHGIQVNRMVEAQSEIFTRLQALRHVPGAMLQRFEQVYESPYDQTMAVKFSYRIGDLDLFVTNLEKMVKFHYDQEFTENLENLLTSS